ncbi:hypothetical protein AHAS_Ahas15G0298300 [Arachis hypogaea]
MCRFTPCIPTLPRNNRRKAQPQNIRTRENNDPQFVGVLEINTQTKQRSSVCGFSRDQYTIAQRSSVRGFFPRSAHNSTAILSSWVIPEINTQRNNDPQSVGYTRDQHITVSGLFP